MNGNTSRIAHQLVMIFQDGSDIPERFKRGSSATKFKKDSLIENRFQEHLESWSNSIKSIIENVPDSQQAWRFIKLEPQVDKNEINSVAYNKDFISFTQLLIRRRDIDNCDAIELGHLCLLLTAFQRKIETNYELFSH
jgi:hypothetical protein